MHILIVRNNSNSHATDASLLLATYLNSQGIGYSIIESIDLTIPNMALQRSKLAEEKADLAVVLGGDGTILRTARLIGISGVPILGINFGRLGFLANSSEDGVVAIVAAALSGDVTREERTNLRIDIASGGDEVDLYGGGPCGAGHDLGEAGGAKEAGTKSFFALNELAITRGANGRIIDFSLDISGSHIANMRGDGVVVATATGSTAYALSAGGPLVAPGFEGLIAVPLAPHTLHSRAVVTASNDIVEINLTPGSGMREATLFVDGEMLSFDEQPRCIYVRKGASPTTLLRYKQQGFYELVSETFF